MHLDLDLTVEKADLKQGFGLEGMAAEQRAGDARLRELLELGGMPVRTEPRDLFREMQGWCAPDNTCSF